VLFLNPLPIANVIAGSAALIVSFLILFKNFKSIINISFFASFFLWGSSWILMGLLFLYEHPLYGAELIRDFNVSFGLAAAFGFFVNAFIMYKGEHYFKKWYFSLPILITVAACSIIAAIFDTVVYDSPTGLDIGTGIKTTQDPWVMIFIYIIPGIMTVLSIIYFILTRVEVTESIIKKRILYFILGFSSIIAGMIVIAISGLVEQLLSLSETWENVSLLIGFGFWFIGPILCFLGFNIGRKIFPRTDIKNEEN
jgi:hypothetical protein